MSAGYPIAADDRVRTFTVSAGQSLFGPFTFKIWDIADVVLETRATADDPWTPVSSGVTVALTGTAPATFTVTKTGLATGLLGRVKGVRVPEREDNATRAGAISSTRLEEDLDKLTTIAQETRRDATEAAANSVAAKASADAALATVGDLVDGLIPVGSITNARMADMPAGTFKLRKLADGDGPPGDYDADTAKEELGLGNVDNTADANKPLSTPMLSRLAQYETTVLRLCNVASPALVTSALLQAALDAAPTLEHLKYVPGDYAHDAQITFTDRNMTLEFPGAGTTLIDWNGGSAGYRFNDTAETFDDMKMFSVLGGAEHKTTTFGTRRLFDARWLPRPYLVPGAASITTEDVIATGADWAAADAWDRVIYTEHAQGASHVRTQSAGQRDVIVGAGIEHVRPLIARHYDSDLNYTSASILATHCAAQLMTVSSVTGTFEVGDMLVSGTKRARLMEDLGSSVFLVIQTAGAAFAPSDAITGTLSGATATVSVFDTDLALAGETLQVDGLEGVGNQYAVSIPNPTNLFRKFNSAAIAQVHGNCSYGGVNLEYVRDAEVSDDLPIYLTGNGALGIRAVAVEDCRLFANVKALGSPTGTVGILFAKGSSGDADMDACKNNLFDVRGGAGLSALYSIDPAIVAADNITRRVALNAVTGRLVDQLIVPHLSSDPTPVAGGIYYNTSIGSLKGSNGVSWYTITWS